VNLWALTSSSVAVNRVEKLKSRVTGAGASTGAGEPEHLLAMEHPVVPVAMLRDGRLLLEENHPDRGWDLVLATFADGRLTRSEYARADRDERAASLSADEPSEPVWSPDEAALYYGQGNSISPGPGRTSYFAPRSVGCFPSRRSFIGWSDSGSGPS
jgi:hypothetical protein